MAFENHLMISDRAIFIMAGHMTIFGQLISVYTRWLQLCCISELSWKNSWFRNGCNEQIYQKIDHVYDMMDGMAKVVVDSVLASEAHD
jgi:hypothetical protein